MGDIFMGCLCSVCLAERRGLDYVYSQDIQ